jgi:cyclohexanone monooxygenase
LTNGEELPADIVVCATGLTLNFLGDMVFTVDQKPVDFSKAIIYQGMMLSDLPNAIVAIGYTNLSWTLKADLTSQYACRLIKYMDRHGYTTAMAKGDPQVKPQNFMPSKEPANIYPNKVTENRGKWRPIIGWTSQSCDGVAWTMA